MLEFDSIEGLLLDRVSNESSIGHRQSVASAKDNKGILAHFMDIGQGDDFLVDHSACLGSPV